MDYLTQLKKDKKLSPILTHTFPPFKRRKNIALRLMTSIVSQQLSNKVAEVIYRRFLDLFDGKEPDAVQVLAVELPVLRSVGLSHAKASYIHNVAKFCIENKVTDKKLNKMSDEAVIDLLTQIKGVGRWTVEMLLIFSLGREDVFAADDLALQNAMIRLYKLDDDNKKILTLRMKNIADKWSPFRSFACLHLWHWKDNNS